MRTIERDIASAVIISSDHKVLLGQKKPSSGAVYADGSWLIPGGGIEPGETALAALRREIIEETSLDIGPYTPVLVEDKATHSSPKTFPNGEQIIVQMKFFTYRIDIPQTAAATPVHSSEELPTLKWIDTHSLHDYKLPPPSITLFTKLGLLTQGHLGP